MIEILVLYVLKRYDCSIYRISKIIETTFFALFKPSFGSLNPAIKRLEGMGCIEVSSSLTEGGKRVKRVSITSFGEKYFKNCMQTYEFTNPSNFLNDANILLFCSNILEGEDLLKFLDNLNLQCKIFINKINSGLNDSYNPLNDLQKKIVNEILFQTKKIEGICEKGQ
ncbi:MAG: PadR family transcriptional regulator [Cyanobacteria bacterium SIG30]|nr:PadR family transcriptional regulator [Cyanobacteria bacterium SIG30]